MQMQSLFACSLQMVVNALQPSVMPKIRDRMQNVLEPLISISYSGEEELYSVYVPTNHLYIGDIILVNSKDVVRPNLSVREGIEIVVSGGMSMPQMLTTFDSGLVRHGPRNNRS